MKTPEELNTIKKEFESLTMKLSDLTEDELAQVTGGVQLPQVGFALWINGASPIKGDDSFSAPPDAGTTSQRQVIG